MQGFSELFHDLDGMTKTGGRIDRMIAYFKIADPEDAGWAAWFLAGNRIKGAVRTGDLRVWASAKSGWPLWLIEESYERVGDLAETLSLLIVGKEHGGSPSLRVFLPPLIDLLVDDFLRLPAINRQTKSALTYKYITLYQLECFTAAVWLGFVVSAHDPDPSTHFYPDLGRAQNVPGRVMPTTSFLSPVCP